MFVSEVPGSMQFELFDVYRVAILSRGKRV